MSEPVHCQLHNCCTIAQAALPVYLINPLVASNALTINAAQGINNSNASIHTGTLNINSHDGFLNNTNGQINAQSFNANIAGQLDNTRGKISVVGNANLKTGDVVATNGSFKSTSGNFTLDSAGNITMTSSHLDASGDLTVKAQARSSSTARKPTPALKPAPMCAKACKPSAPRSRPKATSPSSANNPSRWTPPT